PKSIGRRHPALPARSRLSPHRPPASARTSGPFDPTIIAPIPRLRRTQPSAHQKPGGDLYASHPCPVGSAWAGTTSAWARSPWRADHVSRLLQFDPTIKPGRYQDMSADAGARVALDQGAWVEVADMCSGVHTSTTSTGESAPLTPALQGFFDDFPLPQSWGSSTHR